MRVLVFGRTGQVARALIQAAPEQGAEVVALSRATADLTDPEACAAAIAASTAEVVINAAAYTGVDAAEADADTAHLVNAAAPGAMARACAAKGVPFVHLSTDYVFDGSGSRPWRPQDAPAPLGAYGRSKLAGEEQVALAGGTYVILRTSWVFDGDGKNFLTTMLRLSETRDTLSIVADQVGGPTPALAIARACLSIARTLWAGQKASGIYHFAGRPDVSWAEFARAIFATFDRDVTVTEIPSAEYPTPAARPGNSRLDCTTLDDVFGIVRPRWQDALDTIRKART